MRRVFGAKKDKEPPPSLNDASDRVIILSLDFLFYSLIVYLDSSVIIIFRNYDYD